MTFASGELVVNCNQVDNPFSPNLLRKVHFGSSASLITDFTPYSEVYGAHPSTFCFNAQGDMVRPSRGTPASCSDELLQVDLGNLVECISPDKVYYSMRPNGPHHFEDMRGLEEGDRIEVLERRGTWIRDDVGWLPLVMMNEPLFAVFYY